MTVEGLGFGYQSAEQVLNNVSFTIHEGDTNGLLGHNGAGKTTVLRILAGLLRPWAGVVEYPSPYGETRKAYMPEEGGIYEKLTCRQNLVFRGLACGMRRRQIEARTDALVQELGMAGFIGRLAGTCSYGQRKRLSFACSMLLDPSLILLDEPTNGVDPETRMLFVGILNRCREEGKTTVIASHDLHMIGEVCGFVTLLHHGAVRFSGVLEAKGPIYDWYLSLTRERGGAA